MNINTLNSARSPRMPNGKLSGVVAGLALFATGCATTYSGGVVEASNCVSSTAEYNMREGDKLIIGVGDISVDRDLRDYLSVTMLGGRLEFVDTPGSDADDEIATLTIDPRAVPGTQTFEENGVTVSISLLLKGGSDGHTVQIVKTCPTASP